MRSDMWVSEAAWHEKKHHHRVCALSHDRHGGWIILKHPSFCLFVTPRLWLHPHSPLNMCCLPLQHFPPFHAHVDESRSDPKLWLRCESQLMTCLWVTWHSTSCTVTLQEKKKKKLVQEYVLIRVPDDTHYWKAVMKMMTFLNGVQLCRNELPILPCPLILNLLC